MGLTDNFDRLNKKKGGDEQKTDTKNQKRPATGARNLCFIQPDGRRLFLGYAYLVSGEYVPDDSAIILVFTSHTITLKGHNLETLFESLLTHEPERIVCEDERYKSTDDAESVIVTSISVTKGSGI